MPRTDNLRELPTGLPAPVDDGACDHLRGLRIPSVPLMSTDRQAVDLCRLGGWTVVYCYPRTGRPGVAVPKEWDEIPGARGCTPQACAYRDHFGELQALGARVFGLSAQTTDYQREAVERLRLPFALLSDEALEFARALRLPTFVFDSVVLIKRLTLLVLDGRVSEVFYPVFPSDQDAGHVIAWLARGARHA